MFYKLLFLCNVYTLFFLQANGGKFPDNKEISVVLSSKPELKKYMKRVMPFVQATRDKVNSTGLSALRLTLDFDEMAVLATNKAYLENTLDVSYLNFVTLSLRQQN